MNALTLIKLIRKLAKNNKKKIFTLKELTWLSGETPASVAMALIRGKKNGVVGRISNLWFNLMDSPFLEEVALELKQPSYISFESALYHHGVLSQSPKGMITLATTSRPAKFSTALGNISFIHLQPKLFFGFDENKMAAPEKAFLDLLYIRIKKGNFSIPETLYVDTLNKRILLTWAKLYPAYVGKFLQNLFRRP